MPISGFRISARLVGFEQVFAKLKGFEPKLRQKILKKALPAGARVILKRARELVPISDDPRLEPKLLKKALGTKVKAYSRSGVVIVVIGPRVGFKRNRKTKRREQTKFSRLLGVKQVRRKGLLGLLGAKQAKLVYQNPTQYAHLAGPHRHQRWLNDAMSQAEKQAQEVTLQEIQAGIEEAAK